MAEAEVKLEVEKAKAAYKEMQAIYQPLSSQPPSETRKKAQSDFLKAEDRVTKAKAKLKVLQSPPESRISF